MVQDHTSLSPFIIASGLRVKPCTHSPGIFTSLAYRIGFDKKTVSDSNNYKKMSAWCREMEEKYKLQQVLSPRRFLSKEMRRIPRSDARKTPMKNDISECLVSSKNYHEFEALMKQKSYQVIKSRGIAFVDNKGVYVKGSELGDSLATGPEIGLSQRQYKKYNCKWLIMNKIFFCILTSYNINTKCLCYLNQHPN